ncbi:MAG TPA: ATP-binding protein [Chryseosolibacter sp.]|nr:ATP-binding protein [Chryseosolibacter sp.]
MTTDEFELRERVKELNCLYELSRIAWEANNDADAIIHKTLEILPGAMQHPKLAEANISIGSRLYSTGGFDKCEMMIAEKLSFDKKKFGTVKIGYRRGSPKSKAMSFLAEEKSLLKTVARELSLVIHRVSIEEEKRKLQTQLQHVERLAFVGELSAGIAHELNEPLGRVLGFAQLIKKAGSLNDQQREDVERIIKASLYSREIIKKLMIFSRQMPQQITKVNVNNIVESILYFIDVRFQSRGIAIIKKLDPALPEILADEVQISQVLVNLITNSVYAMPEGGRIFVTTSGRGQHVSLIVRDTGTGMAADIKKKIFEPFFTTKPVGQGTGLGLSVVQGIVDSHHGQIAVSSTPGRGTKFEIRLPVKHKKK